MRLVPIQVPISPAGTNLGDDVIHIVGRIVRWWSMIEFTVDSSIRDLLDRPDTSNMDTTLIMSFKHRLRLLKDLLRETVPDQEALAKLTTIINRIASLQSYRDFVVHGMLVTDSGRPETHVYMSRIRWSSPRKVQRTFVRKEKLLQIEQRIVRSQMELFMATAGCHDRTWRPSLDIMPPQT
jgi:hypothetical protein